ncbi:MAG TPA: MFS transporter [Herpetosiphonaceae bacterium]
MLNTRGRLRAWGSQSYIRLQQQVTLWRSGNFMKLWAGETVSMIGSQISHLALPLTAALFLQATPEQMGILNALSFAPYLILTVFAGVWVDHARRQPILITANLGRAILLGLIPVLAWSNMLRMEYLWVITFLIGTCTMFFELAYQSFLPRVVRRYQLVDANSKLSATASIAEITGPGLAGGLIQLLTAPIAVIIDAISFLFSAITLWLIQTPPREQTEPVQWSKIRQEVPEGFRLNFQNGYLRAFAGEAATYNFWWNAINTAFLLYVVRNLQMSAGMLGVVFAVGSAGALLGALLTTRATSRIGLGWIMIGSSALSAIAPLLFGLATGPGWFAIGVIMAAFFIRGIGMTACNVHVNALRQIITPDDMRGRINASYRLLTYGVVPLGALLGGFLGEQIGLYNTLIVCTLGLACSWLWLFFSPVKHLKQQPSTVSEANALLKGQPAVSIAKVEGQPAVADSAGADSLPTGDQLERSRGA